MGNNNYPLPSPPPQGGREQIELFARTVSISSSSALASGIAPETHVLAIMVNLAPAPDRSLRTFLSRVGIRLRLDVSGYPCSLPRQAAPLQLEHMLCHRIERCRRRCFAPRVRSFTRFKSNGRPICLLVMLLDFSERAASSLPFHDTGNQRRHLRC